MTGRKVASIAIDVTRPVQSPFNFLTVRPQHPIFLSLLSDLSCRYAENRRDTMYNSGCILVISGIRQHALDCRALLCET